MFSSDLYVFCLFAVNVQSFVEPVTSHMHQDDLEEGSIESVTSSDDGDQSLEEQSLSMQADLLERIGTAEEAHNMDLFEQLRAWQAEQREQLIREQQQQLSQLQAEQQAAESRLIVQRQNLWNSSKNSPPSPHVSSLRQKYSERRTPAGLPQAIATSTLALARLRLQESVMVSGDLTASTPVEDSQHTPLNTSKTSIPPEEQPTSFDLKSEAASFTPGIRSENDKLYRLPNCVSGQCASTFVQQFTVRNVSGQVLIRSTPIWSQCPSIHKQFF